MMYSVRVRLDCHLGPNDFNLSLLKHNDRSLPLRLVGWPKVCWTHVLDICHVCRPFLLVN